MTPTITVCTDASFSIKHGCAAWARLIRKDNLLESDGALPNSES